MTHFVYIPENTYKIREGYYTRNQFVKLLRKYSDDALRVGFLADMLEE